MLVGCMSNTLSLSKSIPTSCPPVLFAADHKIYLGINNADFTLDNITYKAEINNALFSEGCKIKDNAFTSILSLLFVTVPIQENVEMIHLPFYIAMVDVNNNIRDIQYYSATGKFNINIETNEKIETDLTNKILLTMPSINESFTIIVGFMLDEKRLKFIN